MFKENLNVDNNANEQDVNPEKGTCSQSDFNNYLDTQIDLFRSAENVQATRDELGHEPSDEELAEHYIKIGGAKDFADKNWHKIAS